jgi:hypothetical protein
MSIPAPAVRRVTRTQWTWTRPRQYGWPLLQMTDLPPYCPSKGYAGYPGRKGTPVIPHKIEVVTSRLNDSPPVLDHIRVYGPWAARPEGGSRWHEIRVRETPDENFALVFYAPDWVMDLADEALRLAAKES